MAIEEVRSPWSITPDQPSRRRGISPGANSSPSLARGDQGHVAPLIGKSGPQPVSAKRDNGRGREPKRDRRLPPAPMTDARHHRASRDGPVVVLVPYPVEVPSADAPKYARRLPPLPRYPSDRREAWRPQRAIPPSKAERLKRFVRRHAPPKRDRPGVHAARSHVAQGAAGGLTEEPHQGPPLRPDPRPEREGP